MNKENIENATCINVFMKHECDMENENEPKHEYEMKGNMS